MKRFTHLLFFQALRLIMLYALCVVLFVVAKPLFVVAQPAAVRGNASVMDVLSAMWHGLPLDLATAGYVCAPVWLLSVVALWRGWGKWSLLFRVWAGVIGIVVALVFVGDACLYSFWGMKLDATVWTYLSQPQGALSSVSTSFALYATLSVILVAVAFYYFATAVVLPRSEAAVRSSRKENHWLTRLGFSLVWLVCGGILFLAIRGGVGKSTANVGMVYFSNTPFLNHTAVNPLFSLVSSSAKTRNFKKEGRFFSEAERQRIFSSLHYSRESHVPDSLRLLRDNRPNVLIVLMEGCGGTFVHAVDSLADPTVTPHLNRLASEGVVFTEVYANSFRTDRGMVCTLSGCPAFPDLSVMKLPALCDRLPSIASSLKRAGYTTSFLYGGDINFTNTHGYLQSTGYERIDGEEAFPASVRHTHNWGVTDRITFDTLYQRIIRMPEHQPWHMGFLTLASHEPWGVPYNRLKHDPVANSMAYLDDCIGRFISRLRQTKAWEHTLIVFLPDHGISYPEGIQETDERRNHIPIIWTGGAISRHREIHTLCNQTDLAATLLGQLGITHRDFPLSRDVLSSTYTHPSAVHAWPEGISWKDATGFSALNILAKPAEPIVEHPHHSPQRVQAVKAFLQTAYDYLGRMQ